MANVCALQTAILVSQCNLNTKLFFECIMLHCDQHFGLNLNLASKPSAVPGRLGFALLCHRHSGGGGCCAECFEIQVTLKTSNYTLPNEQKF